MRIHRIRQSQWMLCLGVSLCAVAMTYWPDGLAIFRYDRVAILSGQWWRLVTGHLIHMNAQHLLFNLLGLFLITELIWGRLPVQHGFGLMVATSAGISWLLWALHPELLWYAGLSGVLHGIWAGCALAGLMGQEVQRNGRSISFIFNNVLRARFVYVAAILLLTVKLAIEWRYGASVHTEQTIGAPVITVAHWYGTLIGSIYVVLWRIGAILRNEKHV